MLTQIDLKWLLTSQRSLQVFAPRNYVTLELHFYCPNLLQVALMWLVSHFIIIHMNSTLEPQFLNIIYFWSKHQTHKLFYTFNITRITLHFSTIPLKWSMNHQSSWWPYTSKGLGLDRQTVLGNVNSTYLQFFSSSIVTLQVFTICSSGSRIGISVHISSVRSLHSTVAISMVFDEHSSFS